MHIAVRTILSALLILSASASAFALDPPESRPPVADFSIDDLDGDSVSLSDFEGKVVVMAFWATWCEPCLQEAPHMNRFYEDYADDGLVVLAISTDGPETISDVRNVVRRNRWSMIVVTDFDGSLTAQLNPRGTNPYSVFIDRAGRLAEAHEGYSSGDEVGYEETIQQLLAETE